MLANVTKLLDRGNDWQVQAKFGREWVINEETPTPFHRAVVFSHSNNAGHWGVDMKTGFRVEFLKEKV